MNTTDSMNEKKFAAKLIAIKTQATELAEAKSESKAMLEGIASASIDCTVQIMKGYHRLTGNFIYWLKDRIIDCADKFTANNRNFKTIDRAIWFKSEYEDYTRGKGIYFTMLHDMLEAELNYS